GANYTNINSDGSDLRFYDPSNNQCSYYIDTWNDAAASNIIWVKVPISGTGAIFMFYGNAAATSVVSSGDNTFFFFDDFNASSLNTTKWGSTTLNSGSSITQNGSGNVTLTSGGSTDLSGAQIIGKTSFNVNDGVIVETKLGAVAPQNTGSRGSLCGASDVTPGSVICYFDAGTLSDWAIIAVGRGAQWGHWFEQCNATTVNDVACIESPVPGSAISLPNGALMSVSFSSSMIYYSNSNPARSGNSNTYPPSGTLYPILSTAHNSTIHNSISITFDYIRLRKYSSSGDPTTTFGSQGTNNLTASISAQTNVLCNGQSTGSATVAASGGSAPLNYLWSNSQTGLTATGLTAATYAVTVTDNIGLTATASATITEPAAVSASVTNQTNVSCYAGSDGTITVSASGGSGTGYEFSKDNGSNWTTGASNPHIYTGLSAGVAYRIRVKDSNGCTSPEIL
ncbi:MAG: DUF2341 domain-containing protein, partial [Bacteroidia bacterium]|nr:DUF2341 domain-containing protein [Bacteroidia bacterium]